MKNFKKAVGMTMAAVMALSMMGTLPAAAEEARATLEFVGTDGNTYTLTETAKLGDYDCWVMDGMYFTEINGEICQVIDLDQYDWVPVDVPLSRAVEVDVSDGKSYDGKIDISEGNDSTPLFIGYDPNNCKSQKISYCIHADFWLPNSYQVNIYGYSVILQKMMLSNTNGPQTLTLGGLTQTVILFNGTMGEAFSKVQVEFLKEGSKGEKKMDYSFYTVVRE